jgi:Cys-tRNA(Pro) deacylase
MSDAIERFLAAAAELGASPEVRRFPQGTKTAVDAASAIGCDVGQIVKSLVLAADDRPLLALVSGSNRADLGRLAALARATHVRRATPEEARTATGYAVGGTPPFGHPRPVPTFCDEDLLRYDVVWAAAGTPDSVFPLAPTELLSWTNAEVAAIAESTGP